MKNEHTLAQKTMRMHWSLGWDPADTKINDK